MAVTVGLAGAGHRATDLYAPALASCLGARFAGIWVPRAQAAAPLAEKHGVIAYERFEQFLDHCDAVVFAVPPAAQPDLAGAAARRGKAVLLEVPIAVDVTGAKVLADHCRARSDSDRAHLALCVGGPDVPRQFCAEDLADGRERAADLG
jgi:predicted dehydrogenase